MEWIDSLLGVAGSAASGGILGLVGSLFGGVAKYFQRKQEIKFEQAKWDKEERLLNMQRNMNNDENEHELELASVNLHQLQQAGSYAGLDSSIKAQMSIRSSYKWVDAVRALFRPLLTICLCGMSMFVYYSVESVDSELKSYIAHTIVFTTSTAVVFWFGDRSMTSKLDK